MENQPRLKNFTYKIWSKDAKITKESSDQTPLFNLAVKWLCPLQKLINNS